MAVRQAQMALGILRAYAEEDARYDAVFSHAVGYAHGLQRYRDTGLEALLAASLP